MRIRGLAALLSAAATTLLTAGTAGTAAAAGPVLDPTVPCYYSQCLYQLAVPGGQGLQAWSLQDVGPTPYYRSIFDVTTGARIAVCGTGTSCTSGPIYLPYNTCHQYVAYVGSSSAVNPPAPVQRTSATVWFCGPHLG
jgi:hypothetical protein